MSQNGEGGGSREKKRYAWVQHPHVYLQSCFYRVCSSQTAGYNQAEVAPLFNNNLSALKETFESVNSPTGWLPATTSVPNITVFKKNAHCC